MAKNIFNSIQVRKPQTSTFNLSHDNKLSCNMGDLVPVACMEVIPGDTWNIQSETLLRFAPLIAPVMHKVNVTTHWFFVPNRIVWPNWEKFITANNGSENVPAAPYLDVSADNAYNVEKGSLADYLGLPTGKLLDKTISAPNPFVSAIPFAAYQMIYDDYYRDQNLQESFLDKVGRDYYLNDGANPEIDELGTLQKRSWMHDYFTASLPFAQKGESVQIPLFPDGLQMAVLRNNTGGDRVNWTGEDNDTSDPRDLNVVGSARSQLDWLPNDALFASTTSEQNEEGMTAASINDLRRAFRLQEWLEKMARGGSRYIEQILIHFGVKSSDARLQRPEFLGGVRNPVVISEVLQTSETADTPLATMGGHALSAGRGKNIRYRAEEHGYIIGIMSVTPYTAYQQGIHKHFSRQNYLDYAWPSFAHIGEQEVKSQEIYFEHGDEEGNSETFGYVPRYAEYRYQDSRVSGDFRDNLSFWHMGRIFDNRPKLNSDFIKCDPTTRVFAVEDPNTHKLWSHVFHNIRVNRRLPKYGTPTL